MKIPTIGWELAIVANANVEIEEKPMVRTILMTPMIKKMTKMRPRLSLANSLLRPMAVVAPMLSTTMTDVVSENHNPKMIPGTRHSTKPRPVTSATSRAAPISVKNFGMIAPYDSPTLISRPR